MFTFLLGLLLLGSAQGAVLPIPTAIANEFVDKLLENLSDLMIECGMDPMKLEDMVIGFEYEILGITFSGHLGLTEGFATGLSSMTRAGDAYLDLNSTTTLTAPLRLTNLRFGYSLYIEFMGLEVTPSASIGMESVEIDMVAEAELTSQTLEVTKLDIHSIRGLDIDIDALGPLDFILEFLSELIGGIIKGIVANILEGPIRFFINLILASDGGSGGPSECSAAVASLPFSASQTYKTVGHWKR